MKPEKEIMKSEKRMYASRSGSRLTRSGQALVEAMVAMGVLSVGLMGIFNLLSQSLALNRVVSDNYVASYLTGEGIEVVKNIIDSNIIAGGAGNWLSGLSNGWYEVQYNTVGTNITSDQSRYLKYDTSSHAYAYDSGAATGFKRKVLIQTLGSREVRVLSRVTWTTRGGQASQLDAEDHFYNWRP